MGEEEEEEEEEEENEEEERDECVFYATFFCPYAQRVWIALEAKRKAVRYTWVEVNLYIYTLTPANTYKCVYKGACIHTYIQSFFHTYIHTYIHTCVFSSALYTTEFRPPSVH